MTITVTNHRGEVLTTIEVDDHTEGSDIDRLFERAAENGWCHSCDHCDDLCLPGGEWVKADFCLCSGCACDYAVHGDTMFDPQLD